MNGRHVNAVPGCKTDVKGAEWMADLLCHGLLKASFIPDRWQRELRELLRYRTDGRKALADHLSDPCVLEGANIKLSEVASDVMGLSAQGVLRSWPPATDTKPMAAARPSRLLPFGGLQRGVRLGIGCSVPPRFRPEEDSAAAIVVTTLKADRFERRDDGPVQNVRDFDVVFADGHREPLEVTTSTIPELKDAKAKFKKYGAEVIEVLALSNEWNVFTSIGTQFVGFGVAIERFLIALEASGATSFSLVTDSHDASGITSLARKAGIAFARGTPNYRGRAIVFPPSDDTVWSSDHRDPGAHVLAEVERHASDQGNRRKLGGRGAGPSHLFIWLDEETFRWHDITDGQLPKRAPLLPSEITTVWVVTRNREKLITGWVFDDTAGWRKI